MTTVGAFEAKTHLALLLGRVQRGEKILITNRGRPVAMLVPPEPGRGGDTGALVKEMLAARDLGGPTLGKGLRARDLRGEGRRF
jgi:prevent-host-death family protein